MSFLSKFWYTGDGKPSTSVTASAKQSKKNKGKTSVSSTGDITDVDVTAATAQDFIPFSDIENSMICLNNGLYRMVVEVGSVNYDLKTQSERIRIEQQFRVAISGWDFPFALYTQTREIDNRTILRILNHDAETIGSRYPFLTQYGRQYMEEYRNTTYNTERNLMKRHFVIVNCDDANMIKSNRTETDRRDYAFKKLSSAVNKVMSSLNSMQLEVHCLNTYELSELLFSAINKREGEIIDGIGDFMSDIVESEVNYEQLNREKLSLLFEGFENQLKVEFFNNHDYTPMEYAKAQHLLNQLDRWKEEVLESDEINDEGYFDLSL